MESNALLVIIGGSISLVSALAAILLGHFLEMRRQASQVKQYPAKVLFDKQTEFIDRLAQVLSKVNSYITGLDVWLGEDTQEAKKVVEQLAAKNSCLERLYDLLHSYHMYLPATLVGNGHDLYTSCLFLGQRPSLDKTYECINLLFAFEDGLRKFVGTDSLSRDLMKALAHREPETKSE